MFHPIEIPFDCVMLFNVIKLKEGVTIDDVELTMGEMCNVVKDTYGDDNGGFIAGQVFENAGFVSAEGSVGAPMPEGETAHDLVIITYWKSFEQHEASHADHAFKEKFDHLGTFCDSTHELGYKMLWQGVPE